VAREKVAAISQYIWLILEGGQYNGLEGGRRTLSGTVRTAYISRGGGDRRIDRKTYGQTDG